MPGPDQRASLPTLSALPHCPRSCACLEAAAEGIDRHGVLQVELNLGKALGAWPGGVGKERNVHALAASAVVQRHHVDERRAPRGAGQGAVTPAHGQIQEEQGQSSSRGRVPELFPWPLCTMHP
eukprot:353797-Chlamydomonas_euryale.AAC.3